MLSLARRVGLLFTAVALGACLFDPALPVGARVACDADESCLATERCLSGQCLPREVELPTMDALVVPLAEDSETSLELPLRAVAAADAVVHVVQPPALGRLLCADGVELCRDGCATDAACRIDGPLHYRADADRNGSDVVELFLENLAVPALDGGGLLGPAATLTFDIAPVNDAPSAFSVSASVMQQETIDLAIGGADVDGDALTAEILTAPSAGAMDVAARTPFALDGSGQATLHYTAPDGFSGVVALTYVVRDAAGAESAAAVVEIEVTRRLVAFPPGVPVVIDEDEAALVELRGQTSEGVLTFAVVAFPASGNLEFVDDTHVIFAPVPDFNGSDSFGFVAQVDGDNSETVTVPITVLPVNDAPIYVGSTEAVDEDDTLSFTLQALDIDGTDTLTFAVDDQRPPTRGVASVTGDVLTYVPGPDQFGPDVIAVTCSDGTASVQGLVMVDVLPIDDPPVPLPPPPKRVTEDVGAIISLDGVDLDGDVLSFAISVPPQHGTVAELDAVRGVLLYLPARDYFGSDQLAFVVDDGTSMSDEALVDIIVEPVNDPPVILTSVVQLPAHQQAGVFPIATFDPDGDTDLTLQVTSIPARASAAAEGMTVRYSRPWLEAYLDDVFSIEVTDPDGAMDSAAVNVELVSQPSCALIHNTGGSVGTTVHVIDPGAPGGADRYLAHCDMDRAGGGWTLALRTDGRLNNFTFWSGNWTSESTLNADQPGAITSLEGKLPSFSLVPLTEVMVGLAPFVGANVSGDMRYIVGTLAGPARPSLRSVFTGGTTAPLTTAPIGHASPGRARWLRLLNTATLQANCNDEALRAPSTPSMSLRIGILGNNETNCSSPDSFIGVGSSTEPTTGQRHVPTPSLSIPAFSHVLVRSRDFTAMPSRATCAAHAAAGARITGTYLVNGVSATCDFGSAALCGDTFIDPPEDCDDGNTYGYDGCDSRCRIPVCGNGRKEDPEACDDGNPDDNDACTTNCTPPRCGDGILSIPERCDDSGRVDGDGCSRLCQLEVCGDGIRAGLEQCDDGDLDNATHGCNATCQSTCANLTVDLGEQCDDGNLKSFDGCSSWCELEPGPPDLLDDLEADVDGWSHEIFALSPFGTGPDWATTSLRSASATTSWQAAMWPGEGSARLTAPPIDLTAVPAGATVRVGFSHWFQFLDCADPLFQPDGGIVEISIDGSGFLQVEPEGGYPGEIQPVCGNPFEGMPAFTNDSTGWVTDTINLTPWIGHVVRLGFHVGWDCGNCEVREGWYVDDLQLLVDPP